MPNAGKGVIIFIGDEEPYMSTSRSMAKEYAHVSLDREISTQDVFRDLSDKFSVYMILKPYSGDAEYMSATDKRIYRTWCKLLGSDHVAILPKPERVCDVIFGILAEEKGCFGEFMEEIEDRQIDDDGDRTKVDIAYKSLSTIHDFDTPAKTRVEGASRLNMSVDDDEGEDLI